MLRSAHLAHTCSCGARQDDRATDEHAADAQNHAEAVAGADVATHGGDAVSEVARSARSLAVCES